MEDDWTVLNAHVWEIIQNYVKMFFMGHLVTQAVLKKKNTWVVPAVD